MFVHCDEDGNVLIKPTKSIRVLGGINIANEKRIENYQQAKERCLFEGFEFEKQKDYYIITLNGNGLWVSWNNSKKIEDLIEFNLQLTQTAIKQIGL